MNENKNTSVLNCSNWRRISATWWQSPMVDRFPRVWDVILRILKNHYVSVPLIKRFEETEVIHLRFMRNFSLWGQIDEAIEILEGGLLQFSFTPPEAIGLNGLLTTSTILNEKNRQTCNPDAATILTTVPGRSQRQRSICRNICKITCLTRRWGPAVCKEPDTEVREWTRKEHSDWQLSMGCALVGSLIDVTAFAVVESVSIMNALHNGQDRRSLLYKTIWTGSLGICSNEKWWRKWIPSQGIHLYTLK